MLLLAACGGSADEPESTYAEVICERAVREGVVGDVKLSNTTNVVLDESEGRVDWVVSGDAEGTNAMGGPAYERFYCNVTWIKGGDYTITDVGFVD